MAAWELDILIPTARFVFSVEDGAVDVLPEHRSPEAFVAYRRLRDRRPVVGMTTFPNTVLLRGPLTVSYTHLRAHETPEHLVCRLLLEKKKQKNQAGHMSIT